jgi:hypothetical protein
MSDGRKACYEDEQERLIEAALAKYKKATPGEIMTMMDEIRIHLDVLQKDDSVSRKLGYHLDQIQRAVTTFEVMLSKRK